MALLVRQQDMPSRLCKRKRKQNESSAAKGRGKHKACGGAQGVSATAISTDEKAQNVDGRRARISPPGPDDVVINIEDDAPPGPLLPGRIAKIRCFHSRPELNGVEVRLGSIGIDGLWYCEGIGGPGILLRGEQLTLAK